MDLENFDLVVKFLFFLLQPVIVTEADIKDDTPIEKKIGEKFCGSSVKKSAVTETEKSSVPESQKIPCWILGEGEDVAIVEPIVKPPHQRSKVRNYYSL